jgi:hypothetical protein
MDATDIWDEGHPEPPLRAEILSFLRRNDDQMFTLADIRKEVVPELEIPPNDASAIEVSYGLVGLNVYHGCILSILDELAAKGEIEKRRFEVDQAGWIGQNEAEYEYIESLLGDENQTEEIFYRASRD